MKGQLTGDAEAAGDDSGESDGSLLTRSLLSAGSALERVGVTPADVYSASKRVGLDSLLERVAPSELKDASAKVVDWRASRAYCRSRAEPGVRINLQGREPDGVVPPGEYEAVRDDIVALLREVETPDGQPAFERVAPREDVYDGPRTEDACDVVVVPRGTDHTVGTKLFGREFVPVDIYDHEREGVFLAAGPDVETDASLPGLSLVDVAPLVMALLGQPVPERMTGSPPAALLETAVETASYGDVHFGTALAGDSEDGERTGGQDAEVTERLEDLGYL